MLRYRGRHHYLPEYELTQAHGAELAALRWRYTDVEQVSLTATGSLRLTTAWGTVEQKRPYLYQQAGGERETGAGGYRIHANGEVGLWAGSHDRSRALIIDPELQWQGRIGGSGEEGGPALTVDAGGHPWLAGSTQSANAPGVTATPRGSDIYVVQLSRDGGRCLDRYLA